jgi:hypothetical protein
MKSTRDHTIWHEGDDVIFWEQHAQVYDCFYSYLAFSHWFGMNIHNSSFHLKCKLYCFLYNLIHVFVIGCVE